MPNSASSANCCEFVLLEKSLTQRLPKSSSDTVILLIGLNDPDPFLSGRLLRNEEERNLSFLEQRRKIIKMRKRVAINCCYRLRKLHYFMPSDTPLMKWTLSLFDQSQKNTKRDDTV